MHKNAKYRQNISNKNYHNNKNQALPPHRPLASTLAYSPAGECLSRQPGDAIAGRRRRRPPRKPSRGAKPRGTAMEDQGKRRGGERQTGRHRDAAMQASRRQGRIIRRWRPGIGLASRGRAATSLALPPGSGGHARGSGRSPRRLPREWPPRGHASRSA